MSSGGRAAGSVPLVWVVAFAGVWWGDSLAVAEPMFLAKQYARCTACHYSSSGGGLLTPYGRSLSREEIATFGRRDPASASEDSRAEENFLFGLLDSEAPLQLGLDARPSRLEFRSAGREIPARNLLMNLDLQAAWQRGAWTAYGTAGRRPGGGFVSYEHWLRRRMTDRVSLRGGRFLPAYGVRFADHTTMSRARLDLGEDDQVYGVELGFETDRGMLQVSAGPGRAESLAEDDGRTAATVSGRFQFEPNPRLVLVGSVLHRGEAERAPRSTATGVSLGTSPFSWLVSWSQADIRFQEVSGSDRTTILTNQTSVEVWRGVWLRVSPQILRTAGNPRAEIRRMVFGMDLYPRTHWHVNLSWYRDRLVFTGRLNTRLLAQLHLYL